MGTILTLQPDATAGIDTYVNSASGSQTNTTAGNLSVGAGKYALIKFPGLSAIPVGSTIVSAKMELYCYYSTFLVSSKIGVQFVTGTWAENVSWNTRPTWETTATSYTFPRINPPDGYSQNLWDSYDIAQFVQRWANGEANNGLVISQISCNDAYRSSDYATATQRPKITVEYVAPGTIAPTVITATYQALPCGPIILAAPATMQITTLAQRYALCFDDGQGWEEASMNGSHMNPINLGSIMVGDESPPIRLAINAFLAPGSYTLVLNAGGFCPADLCFAPDNNGIPGAWNDWGKSMQLPITNNRGYNYFFIKVRAQQGENADPMDHSINIIVSM